MFIHKCSGERTNSAPYLTAVKVDPELSTYLLQATNNIPFSGRASRLLSRETGIPNWKRGALIKIHACRRRSRCSPKITLPCKKSQFIRARSGLAVENLTFLGCGGGRVCALFSPQKCHGNHFRDLLEHTEHARENTETSMEIGN